MSKTFFFYDLETSGLDARSDRIMQFAGIRTSLDLDPIGEPYNVLVKLNDDVLPSPEAIMVTGITPQSTQADGLSEAEFAQFLRDEVFTPGTITVGFNNVRFDDEFIRHHMWRNFHDPYEWSYRDERSRWDLLDVVRMTRALRPDGINWPVIDGKATNRLELITKENGIDHYKAHDALSDVEALIAVTRLIKEKQPQLYQYLLDMRDKNRVKALVNLEDKKPFVYVSGRYDTEYNKATVAFPLTSGKNGNVVVYDLRYDPTPFIDLSLDELKKKLYASRDERQKDGFIPLPIKELQYNRTPAVAPLGVLEQESGWDRVQITPDQVQKHKTILASAPHFAENMRTIFESRPGFKKQSDAEAQLYDGFLNDHDKLRIETVRNADERSLADFHPEFIDERLAPLLLRYKARNYPRSLNQNEAAEWERWRSARLMSELPRYMKSLQTHAARTSDENKQFLLQELQLWAESIMPTDISGQEELL